jgi:hypothetical protein
VLGILRPTLVTRRFESKHTLLEARSLPFEERKIRFFQSEQNAFLKAKKRFFESEPSRFLKANQSAFVNANQSAFVKANPIVFFKTNNSPFSRPASANPTVRCCNRCWCKSLSRITASSLCCYRCQCKSKTFFFRIAASSLCSCSCCRHSALSSRPVLSHRSLIRSAHERELPDRYRQFAVDRIVLRLVRSQNA